MKLELKKFDPSKIKNDSVVVFIGKRNTGKSYCMKDILSYNRDIPVGVVVSPTEKANGYFEKFIPKMLIYDELDEKLISKYLNRQINITNSRKKEMNRHGSSTIDPRSFFILDDCMYNKTIMSDKNIRCIFMNGRHYKIFLLITMQHGLGLPPDLRSNIDYVFIFRNNIVKEREKIYNHYAGMFPTFDVFNQVMNQCTENFECLVIDNKVQSNNINDIVFWYKANESNFKMCSRDLWEMQALQDQRELMGIENEHDEEDVEDYDPGVFMKKKNSKLIKVRKNQKY
tara:strand:- start:664 stop:1518 length:855 start_codon:yes stop_codon:yes gene_type:complete